MLHAFIVLNLFCATVRFFACCHNFRAAQGFPTFRSIASLSAFTSIVTVYSRAGRYRSVSLALTRGVSTLTATAWCTQSVFFHTFVIISDRPALNQAVSEFIPVGILRSEPAAILEYLLKFYLSKYFWRFLSVLFTLRHFALWYIRLLNLVKSSLL